MIMQFDTSLFLEILDFLFKSAELLIKAIALLSIAVAVLTYVFNKKKHFFEVVQFCTKRYRDIVRLQQELEVNKNEYFEAKKENEYYQKHLIYFRDHMGLVAEEITYIRQGMLPKQVAKSWLYQMAKRVPFYQNGELANLNKLKEGDNKVLASDREKKLEKAFNNFDELRMIFKMPNEEFNFNAENEEWQKERKRFADVMYRRIKNYKIT